MFKCVVSIILIMLNEWRIQHIPKGGGAPTPKIAIIVQFCPKRHENERIRTPRGRARIPGPYPLGFANANYFIFREQNEIPKIEKFYEVIVPKMAPRHFRRYFRMYTDTLNSIISDLALREPFTTLLDKGRVCRHKKVAMTCAYLGSKQTIMQYVVIVLFYLLIFFKYFNIDLTK